jgi:hypothetical protein
MSQSSFGDQLSSSDLDHETATLSDATLFGTTGSVDKTTRRRLEIITTYKNLLDTKAIQNLNFTTKDDYSRWFIDNVMNLLNTGEYDGQNKDIKPLYDELKNNIPRYLQRRICQEPVRAVPAENNQNVVCVEHNNVVKGITANHRNPTKYKIECVFCI